jgi:hypothetical protein
VVALYTLIGTIWHVLSIPPGAKRERPLAAALLIGSAIVFVWGTVVAMTLTAWQALTVNGSTNATQFASFARVIDALTNATLAPALLFIIATTFWLKRRPHKLRADPKLIGAGAILGSVLIATRGISVLWPNTLQITPQLAWIGLAIWVFTVAITLAVRERRAPSALHVTRQAP